MGVGAAQLRRLDIDRVRYARKQTQQKTHKDEDEWRAWRQVGDEVLHIELRRWADALVLAPLSANTLAKAAGGLCDNLLTCVVRAWDFGTRPLLVSCS